MAALSRRRALICHRADHRGRRVSRCWATTTGQFPAPARRFACCRGIVTARRIDVLRPVCRANADVVVWWSGAGRLGEPDLAPNVPYSYLIPARLPAGSACEPFPLALPSPPPSERMAALLAIPRCRGDTVLVAFVESRSQTDDTVDDWRSGIEYVRTGSPRWLRRPPGGAVVVTGDFSTTPDVNDAATSTAGTAMPMNQLGRIRSPLSRWSLVSAHIRSTMSGVRSHLDQIRVAGWSATGAA